MRLIDADELKKKLRLVQDFIENYENILNAVFNLINNAPTVEPFEPDYVGAERLKARQRGYEDGYHTGMGIGKTLNPKIKQGEWIKITRKGTVPVEYVCSCCGRKIYDDYELSTPMSEFYPFCHCGADMRGDEK